MDQPILPGPRHVLDPLAVDVPPSDTAGALVRWSRGRPRVLLTGDIDLSCAGQIHALAQVLTRRRLDRAVNGAVNGEANGSMRGDVDGEVDGVVEVDASGVTFLDVAGLRAMLALGGEEQRVVVVRPSRCVLYLVTVLAGCGAGLSVHVDAHRPEAVVVTGVSGR